MAFDFGTSASRIAYARGSGSALVTDLAGDARIPSVLAVSAGGGVLAGAQARDRQMLHPEHTVLSIRSLLTASLEELGERGAFFPHQIETASGSMLRINAGGRMRSAIELVAQYLAFLRRTAEISLERPVHSAVVTVPVCFSPFDRQVMRLAARMAGFQRVRLIDEPTATALAWVASGGRGRIAVCCWGAGYLSASILELKTDLVKVIATAGTKSAGGDLIDLQIARDFMSRIRDQVGTLQHEAHVARHLLGVAESAKRVLAERGKAEISVQLAGGAGVVRHTYTAEDLKSWLAPLVAEAEQLCDRLLSDAGMLKGDIDTLVLAGGMTRIADLSTHLSGFLGRSVAEGFNAEEAAVLGACMRARILNRDGSDLLVLDALPCGLGLEGAGGSVSAILERGIALPAGKRDIYTTYLERQTQVAVQLFGNEGLKWAPLARIELSQIPPMKAGIPALEVSFEPDEDGILEISANETTRSKPLGLDVRPARGLASSVVEAMLESLPAAKESGFQEELYLELRQRSRFVLDTLRELARRSVGVMTRDERQLIDKKSRELEEVMEGADFAEMRACIQELEEAARPLMQRDIDTSLLSLLQ